MISRAKQFISNWAVTHPSLISSDVVLVATNYFCGSVPDRKTRKSRRISHTEKFHYTRFVTQCVVNSAQTPVSVWCKPDHPDFLVVDNAVVVSQGNTALEESH